MDNLLVGIIVIIVCLALAGVVAWLSRPRAKKLKCTCFLIAGDYPYCEIHGVTRSAIRNNTHGRHA